MFCISPRLFSVDVKSVYSMSPPQLRSAFKKASADRLSVPKYWDALMYRGSVVRSELSSADISAILNSFSDFQKFSSKPFLRYLVSDLSDKQGLSLLDATLILRNLRKLEVLEEKELLDFFEKLKPKIFEKINNSIPPKHLVLVTRVLTLFPTDSELVSRIRALSINTVDKMDDPFAVLTFLSYFVKAHFAVSGPVSVADEPFYSELPRDADTANVELLKKLLSAAIRLSPKFNARDVVEFSKNFDAISPSLLVSLGHPSAGPIASVISCLARREIKDFKPDELLTLLSVNFGIEKSPLFDEAVYRIRDFRCSNAVALLHSASMAIDTRGALNLAEAATARLNKYDAVSTLNPSDLIVFCESVLKLKKIGKEFHSKSALVQLVPVIRKADEAQGTRLVELYQALGLDEELEQGLKTRKRSSR